MRATRAGGLFSLKNKNKKKSSLFIVLARLIGGLIDSSVDRHANHSVSSKVVTIYYHWLRQNYNVQLPNQCWLVERQTNGMDHERIPGKSCPCWVECFD
jgi:hypothetical protein